MRRRAGYVALLIVATLAVLAQHADGAIDPFTYLQSSYTWTDAIPNAHPTRGDIVGADAINNGTEFVIAYAGGMLGVHRDGEWAEYVAFDTGLLLTGVSEVARPYGMGGTLGVSDANFIYFFDLSMDPKGSRNVASPNDVTDISYDAELHRMIVATVGQIGELNPDGTLTDILSPETSYGIEVIDMEEEPLTYNMLQRENIFSKFNLDGTFHTGGSYTTDLGSPNIIEGIAYTQNHAIMAVQGGFFVYDKLAFQDHMSYEVPEPSTLAMLGLAAMVIASRRGTRR